MIEVVFKGLRGPLDSERRREASRAARATVEAVSVSVKVLYSVERRTGTTKDYS